MADVQIDTGYPQNIVHRPDDDGSEYDLRLYYEGDFAPEAFPDIGDTETIWGELDDARVLTRRFSVHPQAKGMVTYCDLHCGTDSREWIATVEDGGVQRPLEFKTDYLMKWNYHLAMKKGTTAHADFGTATTPVLSEADAAIKKWVKEPCEAPIDPTDGPWKIYTGFQKTKPGVEAFLSPSPIVRESWRYAKKTVALAHIIDRTVGAVYNSTALPVDLWTGTFLLTSAGVHFDGGYWVLTYTYQQASSWDSDLYGSAIDQP